MVLTSDSSKMCRAGSATREKEKKKKKHTKIKRWNWFLQFIYAMSLGREKKMGKHTINIRCRLVGGAALMIVDTLCA